MEPIIVDGETIELTGPHTARVKSKSADDRWYAVDLDGRGGKGECTCKGFEIRRDCRHLKALQRFAAGDAETALGTEEELVTFTLCTSRYMGHKEPGLVLLQQVVKGIVPVGITVQAPRFITHLPYKEALVYEKSLAPRGLLQVEGDDEFTRLYREQLDNLGVAQVKRSLSRIAREHGEGGMGGCPALILLCYEKVHEGEFCHRRVFAQWWSERVGEGVPELTP